MPGCTGACSTLKTAPASVLLLNPNTQDTLIIGADYYESEEQRQKVLKDGGVPLGIGSNSVVKNCIVDKNARIGSNVKIVNEKGVQVGRPQGCSGGDRGDAVAWGFGVWDDEGSERRPGSGCESWR